MVVGLCGGEEKEVRLYFTGENLLSGLVVEVNDQRKRLRSDKLGDSLLGESLSEHSFPVIECLHHDDSLSGHAVLGADSLVTGHTEGEVIKVGGHSQESLCGISGLVLETSDDGDSLAIHKSFSIISVGQSLGWGSGLLLDPADDGLRSSAASIFHRFAILEELESGITADLELLGCFGLLGGVQLAKLDGRVLLSEDTSGLGVFRGECCITTNCIIRIVCVSEITV